MKYLDELIFVLFLTKTKTFLSFLFQALDFLTSYYIIWRDISWKNGVWDLRSDYEISGLDSSHFTHLYLIFDMRFSRNQELYVPRFGDFRSSQI